MRRSSIITIILLVLVIIGLTVALVFTNLPEKVENNDNATENNEKVENKNESQKEEERAKEVSLDDERVKEMYRIINHGDVDFFHYFKKGSITVKDFTDEDIQTIAYFNSANEKKEKIEETEYLRSYKLETKYMDEAVRRIFGDIEYTHSYARFQDSGVESELPKIAEYDSNDDMYYINTGFGGGGDTTVETAITSVKEYEEKYVVTEKLLISVRNDSYGSNTSFSIYPFYGTGIRFSKYLGYISSENIDAISDIKEMYSYNFNSDSVNEGTIKLISKYYDYCTEYKHTFMKNEDGTFYWYKSEIVK